MKKKHNSQADKGFLWIYGQHAVEAALANPNRQKGKIRSVRPLPDSQTHGVAVEIVSKPELDSLCPEGAVHQGIAMQVKPLAPVFLDDVLKEKRQREVLLILDQVTDPHNIGAILRSARFYGRRQLLTRLPFFWRMRMHRRKRRHLLNLPVVELKSFRLFVSVI